MKKEVLTLCSLFCVGSLAAEWELANNIDDGIEDWTVAFNGDAEANPVGSVTTVEDPFGLGQGTVVKIDPGVAGTVTHNVIAGFVLPGDGIEAVDGSLATVYLKVGRPVVAGNPGEVDNTFGLGGGVSSPFAYSNYSAYGRYSSSGIMDFRDEGNADGSFQPISDTAQDTEVYYEIWYVVDHWNWTYDAYVRGGSDFPEITQVNDEDYNFRNEAVENLTEFFFLTSAGNLNDGIKGKDPLYLDDFYVDYSGENLTSPTGIAPVDMSSSLVNIATRGNVGIGDDILIGGFVIDGDEAKEVLIQGVGSELAGLDDSVKLADPTIRLIPAVTFADADTHIVNDDWDSDATEAAEITSSGASVGATVLVAGSQSSAMVVTLEPGAYTVHVNGVSETTGIALVEVYDLD